MIQFLLHLFTGPVRILHSQSGALEFPGGEPELVRHFEPALGRQDSPLGAFLTALDEQEIESQVLPAPCPVPPPRAQLARSPACPACPVRCGSGDNGTARYRSP